MVSFSLPALTCRFAQELNVDPDTWLNPITLQVGQTKTFYIPVILPGSDEQSPFPLFLLKDYLVLRLTSKMAVESGTAANLTVSNFLLWLQHETYPEDEHAQIDSLYKKNGVERKVITHVNMQQIQTVSSSTAITPITLSQFGQLDVGAMHACLRTSFVNTSGGMRTLQNVGRNSTSSVELSNVPIDVDRSINFPFQLMNNDLAIQITNPNFFKYYPLINHFWSNPGLLFTQSTTTNVRRLTGNELFKLTPDAAGVNEVCTITLTNTANSTGYYNLAFRGDVTGSLVYNANAAAIQTALNALPSVKKAGLTATASGPATATFTITWSPPGPVTDLVQIIPTSLAQSTTPEIGSSAVTTVGVDGFSNSGSNFYIDIYGICFNDLHIDSDGKISVYQNFQQ
jgi:hypothetical protein